MRPIVFDAHCDTPVELWRKGERLRENSGQVSLRRAKRLDGWVQFFSFCTPWMNDGLTCPQRYAAAYDYFQAQLREDHDTIRLCRTGADAEAALRDGVCGAFLSIEGAEALDCDPAQLERVYAQGVRMINPVWNLKNALAGSCMTGEGFTDRGLAFCDEARRLGILLDVSHLSDRGFWQLCERSDTPFLASHSCARGVRAPAQPDRRAALRNIPARRCGRAESVHRISHRHGACHAGRRVPPSRSHDGAGRRRARLSRRRSGRLRNAAGRLFGSGRLHSSADIFAGARLLG